MTGRGREARSPATAARQEGRQRHRWGRALLLGALTASLLGTGCGDTGDGDRAAAELRVYRVALEPVIVEVSAVETEVAERAVGSSGAATAANLDAVYREVRPRLLEALVELDRLRPPGQLADVHEGVRRLIILRLDAYGLVVSGYASGDESLYPEAEERLRQANALIPEINLRLCEVDVALGDRDDCRLVG